jgi:hypothetical protein
VNGGKTNAPPKSPSSPFPKYAWFQLRPNLTTGLLRPGASCGRLRSVAHERLVVRASMHVAARASPVTAATALTGAGVAGLCISRDTPSRSFPQRATGSSVCPLWPSGEASQMALDAGSARSVEGRYANRNTMQAFNPREDAAPSIPRYAPNGNPERPHFLASGFLFALLVSRGSWSLPDTAAAHPHDGASYRT